LGAHDALPLIFPAGWWAAGRPAPFASTPVPAALRASSLQRRDAGETRRDASRYARGIHERQEAHPAVAGCGVGGFVEVRINPDACSRRRSGL